MPIEGTITEDDYSAATQLAVTKTGMYLAACLLAIVFFVAYSLDSFRAVFLAIVGIALAWICLSVPRRLRAEYREFKAIAEPVTIEVLEDGLKFSRAHGQTHVLWDHILRLQATAKCLLIYPGARIYHIVPSHFFESPAEFQAFIELVELKSGRLSNYAFKRTSGRDYRVS